MKNAILAFALLLFLPVAASAQTAPDPAKFPVLEKIKSQATGGGKDLSFDYMGQRFGMDAWLISGKGVMQMVLVQPQSGAAYLGGLLIDPSGKELNSEIQTDFIKKNPDRARDILVSARGIDKDAAAKSLSDGKIPPAPSQADALWTSMGKLGVITYGSGDKPIVYAVLDPAQAESKQVGGKLIVLAEGGQIILKIAPLAIQSADSIMPIAQTLGSADPGTAWKNLMDGKIEKLPETPDPKGVMALKDNVTFAQGLNLRTLPFLVYRQGGKGIIRAVKGAPKDWEILLKDMGLGEDKGQN
jgi:hypothetical protein